MRNIILKQKGGNVVMTLYELCRHDVVDLSTGANLGSVDDIIFDSAAATVTHLVLYGKPRLVRPFGARRRPSGALAGN